MNRISRQLVRLAAAALSGWGLASPAHALDAIDRSLVIENQSELCYVERDGSYIDTVDAVIRVSQARALPAAAQQTLNYNHATTRLEVLAAYTLKADGRVLKVDAAGIREQQGALSVSAPQYSDERSTVIIFPDVAQGDRMMYRVRYLNHAPLFAGQFSRLVASGPYAVKQASVVYDLPAELPLQADSRGYRASLPAAPAGRKRYRWDYHGDGLPRREAAAVSPLDDRDRLFVSTFASYAALATAYDDAVLRAAVRSARVEAKARDIVGALDTDRDKAAALLNWVNGNLRAIDIGVSDGNRLAPHSAEQVLDHLYGDATDQVVLARALLASVHIASTPALVNAGGSYALPATASIEALPDVILYVPALDAYADTMRHGLLDFYLNDNELDKPVLLTASGKLARTPATQSDRIQVDSTIDVGADGSAGYAVSANYHGTQGGQVRGSNRSYSDAEQQALVQRLLQQQRLSGEGQVDLGDKNGNAERYTVKYQGHADDFVSFPGPAGVSADGSLVRPIAAAVAALRAEKVRTQAFFCPSQELEEQTRYQLADGVELQALPRPLLIHDDYFDYSADYRHDHDSVLVKRRLRMHHPARVCSADDYRRMRPALDGMARDLASQLILRAPAPPDAVPAPATATAIDVTDAALTQERSIQYVTVHADGSSDTQIDARMRINEPRGRAIISPLRFDYNRTLESMEVLTAYTVKADGRRIAVPAAQIVDQAEAASGDAALYLDSRVTVITFPEVLDGDSVEYQVVWHARVPVFAGNYLGRVFENPFRAQQARYIYDLPQDMPLHADARGFAATPPVSANGRTVYQWDLEPGPKPRLEANAVSEADTWRMLAVSTLADYADMARVYRSRATDQQTVTPEIAALARRLTAGLAQPRARAYAINEWVRKNIRYVALYVGAGGIVPHSAAAVLEHRYGDCKDHATLMDALLSAAGIDSTPAVIDFGYSYYLPTAAVGFNHLITYIPSLDLYLDSTSDNVQAGYLPQEEMGKQVLLTKSGTLARTPATQTFEWREEVAYRVASDGQTAFSGSLAVGGWQAEPMRKIFQKMSAADRQRNVEQLLRNRGRRGGGSTTLAAAEPALPLRLEYAGQLDDVLPLTGPVGLRLEGIGGDLGDYVDVILQEKVRTQPFTCAGANFEERQHYRLAAELEMLAMPAPLAIHNPLLDYSAEYQRRGNGVDLVRRLHMHTGRMLCTPADYAVMRPALLQVRRDLKQQLVVRRKG